MSLRIRTNIPSIQSQTAMERTERATTESMAKLSSGYRINKAADDAAGLAISETLKGKIRSSVQAKRNANDAISMIQVAEGGMNEISNILIRLRELATQAASDTVGNLERSYTNKEYVQLVDEIDRIADTTEFNSFKMLKGSAGNDGKEELVFHVGSGDGTVENTDTVSLNLDLLNMSSDEVFGLGKEAEIGPETRTGSFERETAAAKLTVIDEAIQRLAETRAVLGSKQSRLNSVVNNLEVSIENSQASNSRIRDVDFAEETANFTQQRILSQAGTSVLSQANAYPELALNLLR